MEIKRKLEWQSLFQTKQTLNKDYHKRQRKALHNDQGIKPRRRHNDCKCLCAQHRSTSILKANTDIRGEIDSNTIIVGEFNTPLSPTGRSSKQRIDKEMQTFNETLDQMDLFDILRNCHPNVEQYTLFSSAHRTFSRIDHILGHKSSLSKFKKIEIVSSIFSDHNAM